MVEFSVWTYSLAEPEGELIRMAFRPGDIDSVVSDTEGTTLIKVSNGVFPKTFGDEATIKVAGSFQAVVDYIRRHWHD